MENTHERSDAYALKGGYEQRRFQFALIKEGSFSVLERILSADDFKEDMRQLFYDDAEIAEESLKFLWAQAWYVSAEAGLADTEADKIYLDGAGAAKKARSAKEVLEIHKNTMTAYARAVYNIKEKKDHSAKVSAVINYTALHLCENPTPGKIAAALGFSENYLSRIFKSETGCTISAYIQNEKIAAAKLMLESSDLPVSQVMTYLGYTSQSHFSDNFKKLTGLTPGKYRKNIKQQRQDADTFQEEAFSQLAGTETEKWFIKSMNYGKSKGYEEQDYVISCIRRGKVSALKEMFTDTDYISEMERLYEGSLACVTETIICVWPPAARAALESGVDVEWISRHMQQNIAKLYACIDVEEALELNTRYFSELAQAVSEV